MMVNDDYYLVGGFKHGFYVPFHIWENHPLIDFHILLIYGNHHTIPFCPFHISISILNLYIYIYGMSSFPLTFTPSSFKMGTASTSKSKLKTLPASGDRLTCRFLVPSVWVNILGIKCGLIVG